MQLYQFNLPDRSNDGAVDYAHARNVWEEIALAEAGGFTALGKHVGAWRADDGTVYREPMFAYQVATTREGMEALAAKSFALFPDQLAFFVAEVGSARIFERVNANA
jgi:hypothetical protein